MQVGTAAPPEQTEQPVHTYPDTNPEPTQPTLAEPPEQDAAAEAAPVEESAPKEPFEEAVSQPPAAEQGATPPPQGYYREAPPLQPVNAAPFPAAPPAVPGGETGRQPEGPPPPYLQQPGSMGPPPFQNAGNPAGYPPPEMRQDIPHESGDKPVRGSKTAIWVIIICIVLLCACLAAAVFFDLFGMRSRLGDIIPAFAVKETSSQASDKPAPESSSSAAVSSGPETSNEPVSEPESEPEFISNSRYKAQLYIGPQFDEIREFDENGLARVRNGEKWGVIDRNGLDVSAPIYDYIWSYFDGFALVERDGYYGLIDSMGNEIIPAEWEDAYDYSEETLAVCRDGMWGYINLQGDFVIPLQFDHAYGFSEGYATVYKDGASYFIDRSGNQVSPVYQDTGAFSEGYATVMINDLWGFVDSGFNLVVPCEYEWVDSFYEGAGRAYRNGKNYLVSGSGQLPGPGSEELWSVTNGYAIALSSDYFGLVDSKTGEYVISPQYADMYFFEDGFLPVTSNGSKWFYVNLDNIHQWGTEFDEAMPFYDGFACVRMGSMYALIDTEGNAITDYLYEDMQPHSNQMVGICQNGKWGFLEISPR